MWSWVYDCQVADKPALLLMLECTLQEQTGILLGSLLRVRSSQMLISSSR